MSKPSRVRITVLKCMRPEEVFKESPVRGGPTEPCPVFREGQVFIVEDGRMPEGFCTWAWNDIYKVVLTLRFNGDFPWCDERGVMICCCTDGLRPVIFRVERA